MTGPQDSPEINDHGWTSAHRKVLSPRKPDYVSPRGHEPTFEIPWKSPAAMNELHRERRQVKNFERATARAEYAKRVAGDAVHAVRAMLRALEDLDYVDRLGMLPQGIDRLQAAEDRMTEAVSVLTNALNEAAIAAQTERVAPKPAFVTPRASVSLLRAATPVPDVGDGG